MKIVVTEVSGEGLESFLGKSIVLWCMNYIYTGTLVGVNATCCKLSDASVVYETGGLSDATWKDAQKLPSDWYVNLAAIESFGGGK